MEGEEKIGDDAAIAGAGDGRNRRGGKGERDKDWERQGKSGLGEKGWREGDEDEDGTAKEKRARSTGEEAQGEDEQALI